MPSKKVGESVTKQPIIPFSRQRVEDEIKGLSDAGMDSVEAAYCVRRHAYKALQKASADIQALVHKAGGYDKMNAQQRAKYGTICCSVIEPQTQRIGHCKNIIAELTRQK